MHSGDNATESARVSLTSVTAACSVGRKADKSGCSFTPSALDTLQVESGVNARQALSPNLAAPARMLVEARTGTIVIKGANVPVTRIMATTDNVGNRSMVSLSLPI